MTESDNEADLETIVKDAEGAQFRYRPMKAMPYNQAAFVFGQNQLNDLTDYVEDIKKDPFDPGARGDLGDLLLGDGRAFRGLPADDIKQIAKDAYKSGIEGMGRFVEANADKFFEDLLSGEALYALAMTVPLYKASTLGYDDEEMKRPSYTGSVKTHNDLVGLVNEVKSMAKIAKDGNVDEMTKVIKKRADSKSVPDWAKKLIKYFAGYPRMTEYFFVRDLSIKQQVLNQALTIGEKPNREKLRALIENSLETAYTAWENEVENSKERKDIWEKAIRPYYVEMAKLAYGSEKEDFEKDIDEATDKNDREAERIEAGIRI